MKEQHEIPDLNLAASVARADSPVEEHEVEGLVPYVRAMVAMCLRMDILSLSASQVGLDKRFIVLRKQPFDFLTAFNPQISPAGGSGSIKSREGCLLKPGKVFEVERREDVKVLYNFHDGEKFVMRQDRYQGQLAFALQQAMDCLDGRAVSEHGRDVTQEVEDDHGGSNE